MSEVRLLDAVRHIPAWPDVVTIRVAPAERIELLVAASTSVPFPTSPSSFWFAHNCRMIDETTQIRCAPRLSDHHRVDWTRSGLTIGPSILCPDCGTHGFVTAGRWESA